MTTNAARVLAEVAAAQTRLAQIDKPTRLLDVRLAGIDQPVSLKMELESVIRSYKWRGAGNAMMYNAGQGDMRTVVTASAGNHAQGVARVARTLGVHANIYMPVSTPQMKQDAVREFGGDNVTIYLVGDTYNQAADAAHEMADGRSDKYVYVPAFDNLHTIAGQATMGAEIVNSGQGPYDVAFLQIGGGGMAAGVSAVLRDAYPNMKIIGVEGVDQACMKAAFDAGRLVTLPRVDGFCDGTAVTQAGEVCFDVCRETLDGIMTVTNGDIHGAMEEMYRLTRTVPEPSGAMGLAGLLKWKGMHPDEARGARMLTVISGANMDFNKLSLLFNTAADSTQNRRHLRLAIGEEKGSLLDLANTCFRDVDIKGFHYGKIDQVNAWPVIAFDADDAKMRQIAACLKDNDVSYEDVTGAVDAGRVHYDARLFSNPLMLEVEFPERKGALREFMRVVQPHANMCYFDYRYAGDMQSRALMGFEFPSSERHSSFMDAVREAPVTVRPLDPQASARMLYVSRGPV